jgi:cold shock CspA family protein
MRTHGKLTRWNDDRGFGFITPAQGGEDLFVHVSAFPRGSRPQLEETISFETEMGPKGKLQAVRAMRPGSPRAGRPQARAKGREPGGLVRAILGGAFVLALGAYGYDQIHKKAASTIIDASVSPGTVTRSDGFRCDGRTTCGQMTSCAEAEYFLQHCPNVKMDGNGDGEPCEQQWCN